MGLWRGAVGVARGVEGRGRGGWGGGAVRGPGPGPGLPGGGEMRPPAASGQGSPGRIKSMNT